MIVFNAWALADFFMFVIASIPLDKVTDWSFPIGLAAALGLEVLFRWLHYKREGITSRQAIFGPEYGGTLFWIIPVWTLLLPALLLACGVLLME